MKYNPTLHKLSNGITVILDPMDLDPVNVKVQFRTGSCDETQPLMQTWAPYGMKILSRGDKNGIKI